MNQKLKHIEINIGKACNNKCRFCMSSKPSLWDIKFAKLEDLKEMISSYSLSGYNSIGFLGGDVSIHPNLLDIIKYCKEKKYININIITNGMVFDKKELSQVIVENGLTRVNFSIHSHLDEVEDYLIQVKGGLKRKLNAIDNFNELRKLKKLRDNISINIVLNKHNYKTIIETVLFFYLNKGIDDIRINFVWLADDVKENWDDLRLSYTEFIPYIKRLIYISNKYNIRITFDTVPYCIFNQIDEKNSKELIKKFLGEDLDHITEIQEMNSGETFDWKKKKKDELKIMFESCNKCIYQESCQGIRKEYGNIYGGKEFLPVLK